jgi:spore germination cell wall hydrolase CwlJ-like protein
MSKSTIGKIACVLSAAAVLAALQMSAPAVAANQPLSQPAITLPALAPDTAQQTEAESPADAATLAPTTAPVDQAPVDQAQVECMAKVIVHEAGNQPRRGRAAVAQVIKARTQDPRFATKPCAVVRQPGQFFDVDAYNPPRDTDQWREAVAIATQVINGQGDNPVPGALFFHAVSSPMKGRTKVARIEGHVFYR